MKKSLKTLLKDLCREWMPKSLLAVSTRSLVLSYIGAMRMDGIRRIFTKVLKAMINLIIILMILTKMKNCL